ncbi:MAG TPA: trehalose-6-phosphate synthase [Anaeromyxobacter sp.]|nr:trehalose-6-phosphate synthase [Anaeromyxobacter sp.]
MRAFLALLLPLLVVLGLLAWGASEAVQRTSQRWFEHEMQTRAELLVGGVREAAAGALRHEDRTRARRVLADLTRDERVSAAALCDAGGGLLASTPTRPETLGCKSVRARGPGEGPLGSAWSFEALGVDGPVHVSAVPVADAEGPTGFAVVLEDTAWAARRERQVRLFLWMAFGVVALAAAAVATVAVQFSWRSWTREVRRALWAALPLSGAGTPRPPFARRQFQPLVSDVRALVADLVAEQVEGRAGLWGPERLRDALAKHLPGSEVIVVANREPFQHERGPDGTVSLVHPASGLVTALEPVMEACSGTWIAHGGGAADREFVDGQGRLRVPPGNPTYTLRRVWLSPEEERGYYYGFSNEGLWALCHQAHTRPVFRSEDFASYEEVNARFADAVVEEARGPDPVVLVQDYHFALLPRMIRKRLPRAIVVTFWHIPWPGGERFEVCPFGPELLEGLLGSSILGFQVQAHCNNLLECVDRALEARIDRERQSVVLGGEETLVRAYPISVDWPSRWAESTPPVPECRAELLRELGLPPDALLGVGVDRLDYTKGIEERLLAVERLLDRFPQFRGQFTFLQLAAPSRSRIPRYQELDRSVEELAVRINGRFGAGGYRPIVLLRAHHEPPAVFRAYRAADLCYVSSLHDGMNLVAKEFVAAREDEGGVLILSRFTGASRELSDALLVNPYDLEEASTALATALAMGREEQRARMRAMRALVAEFNVYRWAGRMLVDGGRLRKRARQRGQPGLAAVPPQEDPAARG